MIFPEILKGLGYWVFFSFLIFLSPRKSNPKIKIFKT